MFKAGGVHIRHLFMASLFLIFLYPFLSFLSDTTTYGQCKMGYQRNYVTAQFLCGCATSSEYQSFSFLTLFLIHSLILRIPPFSISVTLVSGQRLKNCSSVLIVRGRYNVIQTSDRIDFPSMHVV